MNLNQSKKVIEALSTLLHQNGFDLTSSEFDRGCKPDFDKFILVFENKEANLMFEFFLYTEDKSESISMDLSYINSDDSSVIMDVETFLEDNDYKLAELLDNDKRDPFEFMFNFFYEFSVALRSYLRPYFIGDRELVSTTIDWNFLAEGYCF